MGFFEAHAVCPRGVPVAGSVRLARVVFFDGSKSSRIGVLQPANDVDAILVDGGSGYFASGDRVLTNLPLVRDRVERFVRREGGVAIAATPYNEDLIPNDCGRGSEACSRHVGLARPGIRRGVVFFDERRRSRRVGPAPKYV